MVYEQVLTFESVEIYVFMFSMDGCFTLFTFLRILSQFLLYLLTAVNLINCSVNLVVHYAKSSVFKSGSY